MAAHPTSEYIGICYGLGMRSAAVLLLALAAAEARAQDRFEIQVYDAQTAPPGGFGLETHLNHVFADVDETHLTFEPHLGVAPWLEVGGYFQTAVRAEDRKSV